MYLSEYYALRRPRGSSLMGDNWDRLISGIIDTHRQYTISMNKKTSTWPQHVIRTDSHGYYNDTSYIRLTPLCLPCFDMLRRNPVLDLDTFLLSPSNDCPPCDICILSVEAAGRTGRPIRLTVWGYVQPIYAPTLMCMEPSA